ncbi:DUF1707 SHOCT-like domain-containing protein [Agromyces sp. SYSU T0242]|uniref:DUF1707 SHOCT-like domain-containing protein n=1 Tax=Agromyces litoreus TaxID=3158561 RepID=UPI003395B6AB
MTGYADPDRPQERLSDTEREEAVAALATARTEGRLTPAELDERSASARAAITRGDLAPLFADLPSASPSPAAPDPTLPEPTPTFAPLASEAGRPARRSRALGGRAGETVMALSPFVALLLFFGFGFWTPGGFTWSWLFFFLIPIVGVIVYGGGRTEAPR